MSSHASVECQPQGFRPRYKYEAIAFNTGPDLSLVLEGETGPNGISPTSADLLDFAAAIFQIERQLRRQSTSPPERFTLRMQLRKPKAWNEEVVAAARDILYLLGDAEWNLDLRPGLQAPIPDHQRNNSRTVKQVALLSGGMDSTCGLATISAQAEQTQSVSFYTRQKSLQKTIASELGYNSLSQWARKWREGAGRGRSFFYRSFLFLSLGATIAESWGARTILQFENGVLATAIPPGTAWLMTKHSHPLLHKYAGNFFSALFGGDWEIKNPFLHLTKRGCLQEAEKAVGKAKIRKLLSKTETCWALTSNHVRGGGKKTPGVPCGICIPCIVRRTALLDEPYYYDLLEDDVKNDERKGEDFRSYYIFLKRVLRTKKSPSKFYALLPPSGRALLDSDSALSLTELHQLFLKFGKEFMSTFKL